MISTPILAGEYTPPGLYDVDYYQLPNGLRVLLKERHQARSVSYRIVVNVGMADFPCGRQETPHFLEHLLFTGTSTHTESEIADLIEEHGGERNAYTDKEETVYQLDIFSKYAVLGLETLTEIITDSQITQENVDTSRNIIHRESGGRPSAVKQWLYKKGIKKEGILLAHEKLLEETPYVCQSLEIADDINRSDILDAYHRYYVPNNMTLIVVGDFETAVMKKRIESTLGMMEAGQPHERHIIRPKPNREALLVTSSLSPLVDNEAVVGAAFIWGGTQSPDYYPLRFIDKYLSDRLYKKLRVEEGKSYSPYVSTIDFSNTGVLYAYADTELSDIDEVVAMIQHEVDLLVQQPVTDEQISLIKNKLLMSIVQGYESNAEIADYYTASLHELEKHGALFFEEDKIDALSASDIQEAAKKYFGIPPVVFHNAPSTTYTQVAILFGFILLVLVYFIIRRFIRRRIRP